LDKRSHIDNFIRFIVHKKFGLSSAEKNVYTFLWMLLLQVRVKIVTSPWVAEVIEICGQFSLLFNILIFLAKLRTEKAHHTCHLTCG